MVNAVAVGGERVEEHSITAERGLKRLTQPRNKITLSIRLGYLTRNGKALPCVNS
jgi:hypothetical protein